MLNRLIEWTTADYPEGKPEPTIVRDGTEVYETYYDLPDGWAHAGVFPIPVTRWQLFKSRVGHGLIMQYPVWKVIVWSILMSLRGRDYIADAEEGE